MLTLDGVVETITSSYLPETTVVKAAQPIRCEAAIPTAMTRNNLGNMVEFHLM
jgi:hypothetical protein